jgi:hypothetical protein
VRPAATKWSGAASPRVFQPFEEPIMRSFISPFAASAAVALAILTSAGASAETSAEQPVACAALTAAEPAKLIEVCSALIDNPATTEGHRLDATITRRRAA